MNSSKVSAVDINLADFRLVVFDIDGTIQDSQHVLQPETREILLRLRDFDLDFTLATGKNLPASRSTADALEVDLPLILSNGCLLQRRNGELVHEELLPLDVTREIIAICEEGGRDLAIYMEEAIYIKVLNHNSSLMIEYGSPALEEVGDWETLDGKLARAHKCLVVDRYSPENLFELERIYRQRIGNQVNYCYTLKEMLEVMPKGISKLSALRHLTEQLGIDMHAVMTFGDGDNDAEMLSAAGLGITVANASQKARQCADLIVASCDQNGPAEFLKELMARAE